MKLWKEILLKMFNLAQLVNCDFIIEWNDSDYGAALFDRFSCLNHDGVSYFFTEPNNESPLNTTAAKLWEDQEGETFTDVITWFSDVIFTVTRPMCCLVISLM